VDPELATAALDNGDLLLLVLTALASDHPRVAERAGERLFRLRAREAEANAVQPESAFITLDKNPVASSFPAGTSDTETATIVVTKSGIWGVISIAGESRGRM
jgi:hypothetical protein